MTAPITPSEVVAAKKASLPDCVIGVFNSAITAAWNGHSATVLKSKVAIEIAYLLQISSCDVVDLGYLDVEPIYRNAGWVVEYNSPAFNETSPAAFKFSKQSER